METLLPRRPSLQQLEAHMEMARRERAKMVGELISAGFSRIRRSVLQWEWQALKAAIARRRSAGIAVALWLVLGPFPSSARSIAGDREKERDLQLCAAFDLHLVGVIERFGDAGVIDPKMLLEAHYRLVSARRACAEGRLAEGLAAYQAIRFDHLD